MNPILQALNNRNNGLLSIISSIKRGNTDAMLDNLLKTNPRFREFYEANKDKSPEQIARENGVDFGALQDLMK